MAQLDLDTRLRLGHALAQWTAERVGEARLLHIKGLAAQVVLPLDVMASADVDVLVEPDRHAEYLACLSACDSVYVNDAATNSTEAHAIEIVSTSLGVAVDVHSRFPGFRASASEVFEELWFRSQVVEIGGWSCRVLDRVGAVLIGVGHAARNPEGSRSDRAAMARWDLLEGQEKAEFHRLVDATGAQAAVHVVLGGYSDADRWEVALYRAHRARAHPVTLWWLTCLAQPTLSSCWDVVRRAIRSRLLRQRFLPASSVLPSIREMAVAIRRRHG